MERRRFTREFKLEAVRLIRDRGCLVRPGIRRSEGASDATAQLGEGVCGRSAGCVSRQRSDEARAAGDRAAQARGDQAEGRARYPKKLSRAVARLRTVETADAMLAAWRVAAVSLMEAQSPLKNVVHGCMRT